MFESPEGVTEVLRQPLSPHPRLSCFRVPHSAGLAPAAMLYRRIRGLVDTLTERI